MPGAARELVDHDSEATLKFWQYVKGGLWGVWGVKDLTYVQNVPRVVGEIGVWATPLDALGDTPMCE